MSTLFFLLVEAENNEALYRLWIRSYQPESPDKPDD